jgi:hypothetical protein
MRLIATCMAGNEADIIEAFVRHNLGLLDALVVLDHVSVDPTAEILAHLVREGLPLVVLQDPNRAFRQDERQTFLARRFLRELDADFCFALDADEFVKAGSRALLEESLAALPAGAYGAVAVQNYVACGDDAGASNPVRRITRRLRREGAPTYKVVLPREFAEGDDTRVSLGNHAAVRLRAGRPEPLAHVPLRDVQLAHYPARSPEQIAKKALVGWLAHRLTRPERFIPADAPGPTPASHWHELFDLIARGEPVSSALVARRLGMEGASGAKDPPAEDLVDDPLACNYELRHAGLASPSPLATLAAWADQLVTDINSGKILSGAH